MNKRSGIESFSETVIGIAWRLIVLAVVLIFLLRGVSYAYSLGHSLLYEHAMAASPGTDVDFTIREGESRGEIADSLIDRRLIDNREAFLLQSRLYKAVYEPGIYTLNTSMTNTEIIKYLKEEGEKLNDLKEKNLVNNSGDRLESAPETDANGEEIIGGGDEYVGNENAESSGETNP